MATGAQGPVSDDHEWLFWVPEEARIRNVSLMPSDTHFPLSPAVREPALCPLPFPATLAPAPGACGAPTEIRQPGAALVSQSCLRLETLESLS